MRQIGTIANEQDAARFGDYLLTLGIDNTVGQSSDGWAVWVASDDQLDRGRAELDAFVVHPGDARYEGVEKAAAGVRTQQEKLAVRRRERFIDVRTRLGQPQQWNAPLTLSLIGISLIVFVLTLRSKDRDEGGTEDVLRINPVRVEVTAEGNFIVYGKGLPAVRHGQVWRLVTPIFLHFSVLHLVFNMFWLRDLGSMVETRRGTLFLAILVLVTAVLSNLAQYSRSGPMFGGMSGVVYGLFGYVWTRGRLDPTAGIGISRDTATIMLVWLVACMTGLLGPIANTAHVVGLIVGLVFGYVPYVARHLRAR